MMDKVSVIVPAFNVGDYIENCISSLLNQTYKNIEIIIVEDCSTDNTLNICKQLKKKYPNLLLEIHSQNLGLERTREDGIKIATGKWIMFLDSDDEYQFDGIEKVIASIVGSEPDIVLCPYERITIKGSEIMGFSIDEGLYNGKTICSELFTGLSLDVLSCVGSKMYNRDFLEKNNLHFDNTYKYNEDGGYIYSCLSKTKCIAIVNVPFYKYYIKECGSIQSSYRRNMFTSISRADKLLKSIIGQYECFVGEVRHGYYLRRAAVMLTSLENEAKYTNFHTFCQVSNEIRQDEDFRLIDEELRIRPCNKVVSAMIMCLKLRMFLLFYCALKIRIKR